MEIEDEVSAVGKEEAVGAFEPCHVVMEEDLSLSLRVAWSRFIDIDPRDSQRFISIAGLDAALMRPCD